MNDFPHNEFTVQSAIDDSSAKMGDLLALETANMRVLWIKESVLAEAAGFAQAHDAKNRRTVIILHCCPITERSLLRRGYTKILLNNVGKAGAHTWV